MVTTRGSITYPLASGEALTVTSIRPPLSEHADVALYSWPIAHMWPELRLPFLAGEFVDTSADRFIVGEVNGVYAGSALCFGPREARDLAVLGMVWTQPKQRRKGISDILLRHTLAEFREMGGVAMYLCTTNPHAFELYARAGFRPLIGDGMRYLAPGHEAFDRTYFTDAGPAEVRPATWGDFAAVTALYNQPTPEWLVKDYPRRVFRETRYEGQYVRVWLPMHGGRGDALVLENPLRRVVGIASLVEVDSFAEQAVRLLDFWACPAYLRQVPDLLEGLVELARAGATEIIQAFVADVDEGKQQLLHLAGFREEARLRDRLRIGDCRTDLLIFGRSFDRRTAPRHSASAYYAGPPAFPGAAELSASQRR